MISIIAALDERRGIGRENRIPWHIREDLVHLKNLTKDNVVILGRKTFESMVGYYSKSGRPMPAKKYVVVSRNSSPHHILIYDVKANFTVCNSLEKAIDEAKQASENREVFIIGGSQIFKEAMEKGLIDKLYLTIVEGDYGADTFFPEYSEFKVLNEEKREEGDYKFKFLTLTK